MQQDWRKNVHSGHKVVDRDGNNIGTIRNVQEQARSAGSQQMGGMGYVEVECNLPNLSKNLYIPLDSFQECTENTCRLNISQDELNTRGWDRRPSSY